MNPSDLPPPLPNQPPMMPPPRKGMSTGVLVLIIVGAVAVLFAGLAALAIPSYQRIQKMAEEIKAKRAKAMEPPKPLTAEQKEALKVFGEQLADALTHSDSEKVKSLLDSEGLADRVFDARMSDFPQASEVRKGFVDGAMKHPGGWLRNVMGSKIKALHYRERNGFPAVVLRIMPEDGGVNYVDIIAKPTGTTFRAVDMFTYMYASYFSDETRGLLATMIPNSGTGKLAAWLGVSNFDNDALDRIKSAGEAMRTGNFTEALRICDALPEKYRSHRMFFMMRLQARMALNATGDAKNDAAYKELLRAAPDVLGKDSTTDLLMIDLYFLDNQLAEADACIERVNKIIGGDPYLKVLRANTHLMMKDYDGALKLANDAQKEEPDLHEAIDTRLSVHAARKDFPALVGELRAFKRSTGITLGRDSLSTEDQYKEFLASPEFAAWEKEIAKP